MTAGKTIFVVDDDPGALKGVERVLKASGFNVEAFTSVEEFYGRADSGDAACFVLDIHLKDMSGIECRRQLEIAGISTPVIFITADHSETTRRSAIDVGCVACLRKPFPAKLLIDAIGNALERSTSAH